MSSTDNKSVTDGPSSRTTVSSTPLRRVLEYRLGRCFTERPDSVLSNLSELDSGYYELRSLTVTPVIPPEIVISGPQDTQPVTSAAELDDRKKNDDTSETSQETTHEDIILSLNTGTANSSAVSLSSLAAADDYQLPANNSHGEILSSLLLHRF